jgi:hypothetical protein
VRVLHLLKLSKEQNRKRYYLHTLQHFNYFLIWNKVLTVRQRVHTRQQVMANKCPWSSPTHFNVWSRAPDTTGMQAALQTRPIILASSPNQTQKLKNQMTQTQPIHSIMIHGVQLKFYLLFSFYLAKSTRLYLQYSTTYLYPLCCRYTDTVAFFASLAQQANLWPAYRVECLTPPHGKFEKHTFFAVYVCFIVKKKGGKAIPATGSGGS